MTNSDADRASQSGIAVLSSKKGYQEFVVAQSNALVEASYKLTLHEQRLLLCCIAQIDSRKSISSQLVFAHGVGWFKITIADYVNTFPDCAKSKSLPTELHEAVDELFEREIRISQPNGDDFRYRWLGARGIKKNGAIMLNISDRILPYLTELTENFTRYHLKHAQKLRLNYSIRLFQMLVQHRTRGELRIELTNLVERLDAPYTLFADIRRRILEPAIEEINSSSNLDVKWSPIKDGRAVRWIEFVFGEAKQSKLHF